MKLLDSCLRTLTHVAAVSGQGRPPSTRPEMEEDNADEGPSQVSDLIRVFVFFLKLVYFIFYNQFFFKEASEVGLVLVRNVSCSVSKPRSVSLHSFQSRDAAAPG